MVQSGEEILVFVVASVEDFLQLLHIFFGEFFAVDELFHASRQLDVAESGGDLFLQLSLLLFATSVFVGGRNCRRRLAFDGVGGGLKRNCSIVLG